MGDSAMLKAARQLRPQTPLHFGFLTTGDRFLENQKQREGVLGKHPFSLAFM